MVSFFHSHICTLAVALIRLPAHPLLRNWAHQSCLCGSRRVLLLPGADPLQKALGRQENLSDYSQCCYPPPSWGGQDLPVVLVWWLWVLLANCIEGRKWQKGEEMEEGADKSRRIGGRRGGERKCEDRRGEENEFSLVPRPSHHPVFDHFYIMQVTKNRTVGRPGNKTNVNQHKPSVAWLLLL